MTENEAIKVFENPTKHITKLLLDEEETICYSSDMVKAFETAIQALEEIQQYRAIGTIDEFKAFKLGRLGNKGFITIGQTVEEFKQEIRAKAIDECIKVIEETVWKDTDMLVESIRELKEGAE